MKFTLAIVAHLSDCFPGFSLTPRPRPISTINAEQTHTIVHISPLINLISGGPAHLGYTCQMGGWGAQLK